MTIDRARIGRERFMTSATQTSDVRTSSVAIDDDTFLVEGRRFPRRSYAGRTDLQQLRRRPDPQSWVSQLTDIAPAGDLRREVPDSSETFSYVSPSMAKIAPT